MDENLARDSERIQQLMHRFTQSFGRRMMNSLVQGQINLPQYNTMHVLAEMDEASMGELAERMGVTMGASTNIVDKLVRSGYATRRRDSRDRRMVKVQLTEKGIETVQRVVRDTTRFLIGILGRIDADEREHYADTYEKMVRFSEQASNNGSE
jgi:DNA-binding MarR family transcriptional regulator